MICEAGDIAVVPFPFSDMPISKVRPAVVISPARANEEQGETLMAMITTAAGGSRPSDTVLADLKVAGLKTACVVRMKLFTLDNRLIAKRIGSLSASDRKAAKDAIGRLIAL